MPCLTALGSNIGNVGLVEVGEVGEGGDTVLEDATRSEVVDEVVGDNVGVVVEWDVVVVAQAASAAPSGALALSGTP